MGRPEFAPDAPPIVWGWWGGWPKGGELGGPGLERTRGSPRSSLTVRPPGSLEKPRGGGSGGVPRGQGVCLDGEMELNPI